MANLYMIVATNEETRMANSLGSVLVVGTDEANARAVALAAKPNGELDAGKFARWTAQLIAAGTITLPATGPMWMGNAYGSLNPLPGA